MTFDVAAWLKNNLGGQPCRVIRRDHDWDFVFGEPGGIAVSVPWRIVGPDHIMITDSDHGQKFGLPKPVDAALHANELVDRAVVSNVTVNEKTADLEITFSNGLTLQLFNNSSGYEGWNAFVADRQIIAMGGGGFCVF